MAEILQDASSSASAFRLIAFIKGQLQMGRPASEIRSDIETVVRLRRYPNALLARPFLTSLSRAELTDSGRRQLVRWAEAVQRERSFVRERVVEHIERFLIEQLRKSDLLVLYGYSSTVCEGIIRRADQNLVVLVVEDLQYGSNSVREHEMVASVLTAAGLSCHIIPFSQLDHLLQANATSITTLDHRRLSLSPQRTLLALLGCDAIDQGGAVLIPSVVAGTPSDSACLAEAFLGANSGVGQLVARRVVVVGESYKVAGSAEISDTSTAAPLRPSWWLRSLHVVGLAVPFRAAQVNLYRIVSGLAAIITDAGIYLPDVDGTIRMTRAQRFWRNRVGEREMHGPAPRDQFGEQREQAGGITVGAVIFDWNGVIALDEPQHFAAFAHICGETSGYALSYPDYARHCGGLTDEEGVVNLLATGMANGEVEWLVERKQEIYRRMVATDEFIVAPGTRQLLLELAAKDIQYRIVTASPLVEVSAVRQGAGLGELLPDTVIEAGVASADRQAVLARLVGDLRGRPQVLVIDDSEGNIRMAAQAGAVTVRIDNHPDSCQTDADFCVQGVRDVRGLVRFESPTRAGEGRAEQQLP